MCSIWLQVIQVQLLITIEKVIYLFFFYPLSNFFFGFSLWIEHSFIHYLLENLTISVSCLKLNKVFDSRMGGSVNGLASADIWYTSTIKS